MKEIQLSQGYVALIDDEDFERVSKFKWHVKVDTHTNYAARNVREGGKHTGLRLHRFVLGINNPKISVDHRNGNGLDCQKHNLRSCTQEQNAANRRKQVSSSRYKGVTWFKRLGNWAVKLQAQNQSIYVGNFASELDAALAYDVAARKHFGEFANTNFQENLCTSVQ